MFSFTEKNQLFSFFLVFPILFVKQTKKELQMAGYHINRYSLILAVLQLHVEVFAFVWHAHHARLLFQHNPRK